MDLYPYEEKHIGIMREIAPECMVLLKSNGDFPLIKPSKIALYGNGTRKTLKGGTGSGDVNSRHFVTVEQGLENAGFEVTTKPWLNAYDETYQNAYNAFVSSIKEKAEAMGIPALFIGMGAVMPEPEYELPLDGEGDTAIYVLSRISGEGSDRNPIKGDLKLTDSEVRDILALYRKHKHFILILNVGGVVDLTPVLEVENILILSQLGAVTGDALADVLLGKAYPSGKLASTWSAWEDYCTVGDFGDPNDTYYTEGIYVGYRYFDSVDKSVLFPFGFGLGYTSFAIGDPDTELDGTLVTVTAKVSNSGNFAGKEVVQLYVSVPAGKLDQSYQVLAAFGKTEELQPGESCTVRLSFDMRDLASFDAEVSGTILEAGNYIIRIGNSSRSHNACTVVNMEETVVVRSLSSCGGDLDYSDWKPEHPISTAYNMELPIIRLKASAFQKEVPERHTVDLKALAAVKELSNGDLAYLCCGNYRTGEESNSMIGNAGMKVPGAAGETTDRLDGIPCLVMADGPAGLRINKQYGVDEQGIYSVGDAIPAAIRDFVDEAMLQFLGIKDPGNMAEVTRKGKICDQYCTAIPIGTALAQSWNEQLCQACGDVVGEEMERFGIHLWLAPAFNIHRSPLCGRNFEYCSEDPLVSGKLSAALTRGVQTHPGCGVTVKHFCCNNQETNRYRSNSVISQRALRDIYLKGFEICIRESKPAAVMTSYNLLNGVHTSESKDLLEGILRGEWGYQGIVMSDWITKMSPMPQKYPYVSTWRSIKAGNDLIMPGGEGDRTEILEAMENGDLTRNDVELCAARVVETAWKLGNAR